MRVLIFGLSDSGKTFLGNELVTILGDRAEFFDGESIRKECDDWDFTVEGRERQLQRMRVLARQVEDKGKIAICGFICPLESFRDTFAADYEIFLDTVDDEDEIFEFPIAQPNYVVNEHRDDYDAREIVWELLDKNFDTRAQTTAIVDTFQPFTDKQKETITKELEKGQVALLVQDVEQTEETPYHVLDVCQQLRLTFAEYAGRLRIFAAPNLTKIIE